MRPLKFLLLAFLFALPATAQSEVGEVAFANSGAAAAQEPFLRGLALLHNFEYPDAAEQFRKAQAADPGFAMAFWGEAMTFTHPVVPAGRRGGARRSRPARRHRRGAAGEGEDGAGERLPAHRRGPLRRRHKGGSGFSLLRRDGRAPPALSGRR